MAVPDLASLVTQRTHNLTSTTVIKSSQARTCATMLALTSHYLATNAKHPRYAPGPPAPLAEPAVIAAVAGRLPGARGPSRISSGVRVEPRSCLLQAGYGPAGGSGLRQRCSIVAATATSMLHRCGSCRAWGADSGSGAGVRGSWGMRESATGQAGGAGTGAGGRAQGRKGRGRKGRGTGARPPPGGAVLAKPMGSDMRARNRTRFANVSLGTDDAQTGGDRPFPAASGEKEGKHACLPDTASRSSCRP